MLLRSAIGVLSLIVLFATKDDLEKRVLKDQPHASDSTVNTALAVSAVTGIVILVFYVFLAFQVRRGARWARIVTWVIAGLGILGALVSFGQPDPTLSRVLGIVVGLIDVAVVVLLASSESNRFFRAHD
jgi:cytochrome c oxidase subunit IV